jgi:hypothetical protein
MGRAILWLVGLPVAVLYILFGIANLQPGYPKLEALAAIIGGLALLTSLVMAWGSVYRALLTACLGTLPLAAWFAYAVPIERSSDPQFFWFSLIIPTFTGLSVFVLWRRRTAEVNTRRADADPTRARQ